MRRDGLTDGVAAGFTDASTVVAAGAATARPTSAAAMSDETARRGMIAMV